MKRKILVRIINAVAWLQRHLIALLGDEVVMARGTYRERRPRTERVARPLRERGVRGGRKMLDIYLDLPEDETIPDEVTNE